MPHVVVAEAFITAATPADNIDSPASWRAPDGKRWVIATAKATDKLVVYDGDTGKTAAQRWWHRHRAGADAATERHRRDRHASALVVERDNHRVQCSSCRSSKPLLVFGADDLKQPYGLWVRAQKDSYEVIVSDNYMSPQNEDLPPPLAELGQRFKRYQLRARAGWLAGAADGRVRRDQRGRRDPHRRIGVRRRRQRSPAAGRGRCRHRHAPARVRPRRRYRGRDIGADLFKAQAEGMALARCADGGGYWIATDQFKDRSLFHVFDRDTLQHVGAFAGGKTANTDGVWLDQSASARFPQGVFYAVDDDQAVAAFDWRDIARALSLRDCLRSARFGAPLSLTACSGVPLPHGERGCTGPLPLWERDRREAPGERRRLGRRRLLRARPFLQRTRHHRHQQVDLLAGDGEVGVKRSELTPPWITPMPCSRSHSSVEPAP